MCEMKLNSSMCILQKGTEETYNFKCTTHPALLHIREVHQQNANYLAKVGRLQINFCQDNEAKRSKTKHNKTTKDS